MITIVIGDQNEGKSLYVSFKVFLAYLKGKEVITNTPLNFPHILVTKEWLIERSKKLDLDLRNKVLFFDELWIWLDSRKAVENTVSTYFFLQSSKDDAEIYLTAQHNKQNDVRLRDNCSKIIECHRYIKVGKEYHRITNDTRFLETINPILNDILYIGGDILVKTTSRGITDFKYRETEFIKAKPIFRLFNTRIKIKPIIKEKKKTRIKKK